MRASKPCRYAIRNIQKIVRILSVFSFIFNDCEYQLLSLLPLSQGHVVYLMAADKIQKHVKCCLFHWTEERDREKGSFQTIGFEHDVNCYILEAFVK